MTATDLLVVADLKRSFGGVRAVDGVSFRVGRGSITGLIGPNGAGKSTALGAIAGALRPSAGSIEFDGDDITGLAPMKRARQGLIRTFQTSSEFQRLTVLENLLVGAKDNPGETLLGALVLGGRSWRAYERKLVARARELLERFQMSDKEDEWAGNLSGGQKRLLEIMRGLMAEPKLLLLDEPMAGVNPTLARGIELHLQRLNDEGLTMLMVEHELGVVERLCDRVVVMAQGKVISEGTMETLRREQEVLDAYLVG
jgi:ABC-type branched-subunit amino acid transport system ATPase component